MSPVSADMDDAMDTRKREWLDAFERMGTVVHACKETETARSTVYNWRQHDEAFALEWADVEEVTTERMEREAYRRAVEGVRRDVLYQGTKVGEEQHYSDTLMIFMLKARRPDKYRENVKMELSGSVSHDLASLSDTDLAAMVDELASKRAA